MRFRKMLFLMVAVIMVHGKTALAVDFPYVAPVAKTPEDTIRSFVQEFSYRENIRYPEARVSIVKSALSAVGRVPYFWGGKYAPDGSYPDWGEPSKVYSKGSTTTGLILPYGLDCSGFVQWAFFDGIGEDAGVGMSTMSQWDASYAIPFGDAIPGDLLFRKEPGHGTNHVGIMVGRNREGTAFAVHCTSSVGGVCISEAGAAGLAIARRVKKLGSISLTSN